MGAANNRARPDEDHTQELLRRASQGSFAAREQLVILHSPLIGSIARRFCRQGRDREDLFQVGCIGLLKAIDRFDPSYQVCFSTYAVPLIMGEIRRYLRDDGPLTISRTLRERSALLEAKRRELQLKWGRDPELWQLAEECRLTQEEAMAALEALRPPLSINELRAPEQHSGPALEMLLADRTAGPELRLDHLDLERHLEQLPPRLAEILRGRYFRDQTQRELAQELGISQVQVSRLERRALDMMRRLMTEDEAG